MFPQIKNAIDPENSNFASSIIVSDNAGLVTIDIICEEVNFNKLSGKRVSHTFKQIRKIPGLVNSLIYISSKTRFGAYASL